MPKYEITMDLQVLNHLGLNLYSSMPAVIAEVVANAWDADAKEVTISIGDDEIVISDNGCGRECKILCVNGLWATGAIMMRAPPNGLRI